MDDALKRVQIKIVPMWIERHRRHIRHFEVIGGTCHVTWRLERTQKELAPEERSVVLEIIRRGEDRGCRLWAVVVMDDHVHTLFTPGLELTAARFIHAWKSVSAHRLCQDSSRTAPLWQRDYFQRWLSAPTAIDACASYIRNNPVRRWPGIENYPWII